MITIVRYTAFGVLFGLLFPAFAIVIEVEQRGGWPLGLGELVRTNPILGIVALAPLVLGGVFHGVGRIQARLQAQLLQRAEAERAMWRLANLDTLTGLGNRRRLLADLAKANDGSRPLPHVLLIDLDRFKFINDTLGHDIGDALLQQIAERITAELEDDMRLYRLGGDEFVAVDFSGANAPVALGERLIECFDLPFRALDNQVVSSGSIGAATMIAGEDSASPALARADLALYQAKAIPGSACVAFEPGMAEEAHQRASMERDIRQALARDEFHVEYQPIVGSRERQVRSFEALVRWHHPIRGVVCPDAFIPFAEVSGLILPLGEFVMRTACADAMRWPATVNVSVNVSAVQLRHSGFEEMVASALAEAGLAADRLTIEITESMLISDIESVSGSIDRLRALGIRFALDDFGTGYSSINHLRKIRLDYLKLDQSFVRRVRADGREAGIISAVIDLARQFDLTTIAEGVEDIEELDLMSGLGASQVQGYFVSRAMAADAIPSFLIDTMTQGGEPAVPIASPRNRSAA